jgi:hypothetical protein
VRKFGPAIAQTFVAILFAIIAISIYWLYEPPPIGFYFRDLMTPVVHPGEFFKLRVRVYWTKGCYSKLYRNIIDAGGRITPMEREVRWNSPGTSEFIVRSLIPLDATPGPATWEVRTEWFCNPVQYKWPYSVVLDPVEFEIRK